MYSYQEKAAVSLAYKLENFVFFCIGAIPPEIERRQKDGSDVKVVSLPSFKGNFNNQEDVDAFEHQNDLLWLEDEARAENKIYVLVAPNIQTVKVSYALMRDWCPSVAASVELSFHRGLVPLIEKPRR